MYIDTTIKVSGQNSDDLDTAIKMYDDLNDEHGQNYISFGNNLVMADEIVYMMRHGFSITSDFDDNLLFYKARKG